MKFAHLADCHIGGWREPKLRELNLLCFRKAIDRCIEENVAFVIIAGDLFHTALPQIDFIKEVAHYLQLLKEHDINVYIVAGSHDYSPSGKTMLDVLEKAGLVENLAKVEENNDKINLSFTVDKTNVKLAGLYGMRNAMEKSKYEVLEKNALEQEKGFKIFVFHALLNELKPNIMDQVESYSISLLPKQFHYYAGGHPHFVFCEKVKDYGVVAYPGPLFPNNFAELEKLKNGGFYIVNVNDTINVNRIDVKLKELLSLNFDVEGKDIEEANSFILSQLNQDVNDKIITLRVQGTLNSGKPTDLDFDGFLNALKGSYVVLKNTNGLKSKEYEDIKVIGNTIEEIENKVVEESLEQSDFNDKDFITKLINALNVEKSEGEKTSDYEERLFSNAVKSLELGGIFNEN